MNNLKYLRCRARVSAKDISSLLNVTVHTYYGMEKELILMTAVDIIMIAKIYNILEQEVLCSEGLISAGSLNNLDELAKLNLVDKKRRMIFNLVGRELQSLSFGKISKLKENLMRDLLSGSFRIK